MLQPHILGRLKEPQEELDLMSVEGKELPVLRQGCIEGGRLWGFRKPFLTAEQFLQ